MNRIKQSTRYNKIIEIILILPIIMVAVSPVIIRGVFLDVGVEADLFWNSDYIVDFFTYYKSKAVFFGALISTLFLSLYLVFCKEKPSFKAIYIPTMIYAGLIIVSFIKSDYSQTSLNGFPERYEGVLVQISYLVIFLYTSVIVKSRKQVNVVIFFIFITTFVVGIIGLLQFINIDILNSDFMSKLIIDPNSSHYQEMVRFKLGTTDTSKNIIYSTLYNPNTLGQYMAMLLPFALFLAPKAKGFMQKGFMYSLVTLIFINLMGSYSRGSVLSVAFVIMIVLVIFRKQLNIKSRHFSYIIISGLFIISIMNIVSQGEILSRYESIITLGTNHEEDEIVDKIKDFEIKSNSVVVSSTTQKLTAEVINNEVVFKDEFENRIEYIVEKETGEVKFDDIIYSDFNLQIVDNFFKFQKGKSALYFVVLDGDFNLLSPQGVIIEYYERDYSNNGFERLGSGRGYIWSRSLPIIGNNLIAGEGPDTFAYAFPQNDVKGKLNYMYDAYVMIDKPHNMYLQIAVNTGLLSLVSFLGIMVLWFYSIYKNVGLKLSLIQLAAVSSVGSFLIASMFTDSTVSVTPTFWIIMGIGLSYSNTTRT